MSQVTITDIKDVTTMPEAEIRKWIADHRADPKNHRYASCVWDDLNTLEAELRRRTQPCKARRESPKPIGPDSDTYNRFMNARSDLDRRISDKDFTRHTGYEIWRNAWLCCERAHGIRAAE